MNSSKERAPNATLNNLVSGINYMTRGRLGRPYLGCGLQTDRVIRGLVPLQPKLDDNWTFSMQDAFIFPFYHQWGIAKSDNPNDPVIIFDPLNGIVATVPPGNIPTTDIHPVK